MDYKSIAKARSMRYRVRTNDFVGSNVDFDPETLRAYSYGWWRFVDRINGLVVFNDYSYSSSTSKHQSKVRGLLRSLGITIDLTIEARKGLQDLDTAIRDYEYRIKELSLKIQAPRTHKAKNLERVAEIEHLQEKIKQIKGLQSGALNKAV
jgi:hypothetical protein